MIHSLNGLRILNTRPAHQAKKLTHEIIEVGGLVVECPTIEIQDNTLWLNSLPDLHTVDQAIFISPNAVHYFFKQLLTHHIHWPSSINIIAIGESTANALNEYQLLCNDIPDVPNSEHLLKLKSLRHVENQKILLIKGKGGRLLIEETLAQREAVVLPLMVYQRELPTIAAEFIESIWQNNQVDIILLTSEQSIQNLFLLFGQDAIPWLQSKPYLVISDRLAQSASLLGIQKIVKSHPQRMINTLLDYSQGLTHDR